MNPQKSKLVRNISDWKLRNQLYIQEFNLQDELKNNLTFPRNYSLLPETERETLLNHISTLYSQYKKQLLKYRDEKIYIPITEVMKPTISKVSAISDATRQKISQALKGKFAGENHPQFNHGCIYKDIKKNGYIFQWKEEGKKYSKSFSINKYGEEEAKNMCENYRNEIYPN
jgi:hypothetical protein